MCAVRHEHVHRNVCVFSSELPGAREALQALEVPATGESKDIGPIFAFGV